jgi:SAM-dependent methyltransferase
MSEMIRRQRWLDSEWVAVRPQLPPPPARVIDLGCGPEGGFVPRLVAAGYDALGIDPVAPDGPEYLAAVFEDVAIDRAADVVIACLSLHHVDDLELTIRAVADALNAGGSLIVVEWASEDFDERTARWCFDRLPSRPDDDAGWLRTHRDRWLESGLPWAEYFTGWLADERMHPAAHILDALGRRFDQVALTRGPYLYSELGTAREAEQAAIDAGELAACGMRYRGRAAVDAQR